MMFGCNAANVEPQGASGAAPSQETANFVQSQKNTKTVLDAIEQLEGRFTAMQEQVLNVRSQSARQLEQLQSLQLQLNLLSQELKGAARQNTNGETAPETNVQEELALLLDQMARMAGDVSMQVQDGNFRFVSCYTQAGQWILIRYDRFTGESWLADQGQWLQLQEAGEQPASIYEITLQRADNDSKGFVAARLDRQTGQTWWLKQNSWQRLQ